MSTAASLSKLLDDYEIDFAFISEHKLRIEHKAFLESIHCNYGAITLCDSSVIPGARCGKGGVAILYKKQCQFSVTPLEIHINDRILGIKIDQRNTKPIYAFSVYMPSVNYSTEEYLECFECLQNLYDTFSELGTIFFLGDFNCDIESVPCNDARRKRLISFLEDTNTSVASMIGLYTFRPTEKTLDYVITNRHLCHLIASNSIIDKDICTVSDHLPILTILQVETISYQVPQNAHVAWNKCSNEDISSYQYILGEELSKLEPPRQYSQTNINSFYNSIVAAVHKAAEVALPSGQYNQHAKPYWTERVKQAHRDQRHQRIEWLKRGRPRSPDNIYYKNYKNAKRTFRKIQTDEINAVERKYYSELDKSAECDVRLFWHVVNKRRKSKSSAVCRLVTDENATSCPEEISETFANHFAQLYVPYDHTRYDKDFKLHIENKVKSLKTIPSNNRCNDLIRPVGLSELKTSVKALKKRKSPGADNVTNEHILHGGPALLLCLKKLFCMMLEANVIPDQCK
ncbi:MAG: endonuclease/exonuclease/phosphatase family protein, partial [Candidatus Thiodiazotropha taylori]|nr:endonuclease/exonuclease/phosphatase family protein [Candidatus Thiodiazotropha taylori]MCW4311179.1 endonuclease/exonuclease/phosphatase family protein [Candidatus Thiodiazotropha endolucinida]